jgi:hypothetical protein
MKVLLNLQVSRIFHFLEHIRFRRAAVARSIKKPFLGYADNLKSNYTKNGKANIDDENHF